MRGEHTITLHRRPEPTKNGDHVYRREGVRASVYVNKRVFVRGAVPDQLTLSASSDIFRLPHNYDPEASAKRVEVLEAKATKKREQADAMLEKARALGSQAEIEAAKLSALS
jgi:hypothetical protein